jgi:POT family proton-dependent oligopeptide transporter
MKALNFLRPNQPKEMYLLALTEMTQRFAFWGIANLLVIYLVQYQKFSDVVADQLFGIFTGAAFALPVIGGYIADRLNYRLPVIWGMWSTAIGCFLIATGEPFLLYISLFLVAMGAAIFTPSIYTLLGSLYRHHHHMREGGFSIYYSTVNIGTFIALLLIGSLGQAKLWSVAFVIAGLVQLTGLYFFSKAIKNPDLLLISKTKKGDKETKEAPLHKREQDRILFIGILSLVSIFFWMAYNQGGSSLNLFALRYTDRHLMGFEIPPSWLLSSETLYLILFAVPLAALYTFLSKRGLNPSPAYKSALSLICMAVCFVIMSIAARMIPSGAESAWVSPFYLIGAYAMMALGEMLIAPIGLSLITHLSPHRFTALLVGCWYLCIGIAFYLGGAIAPLMSHLKSLSSFFDIFVVLCGAAGIAVLACVNRLDRLRHLKDSL